MPLIDSAGLFAAALSSNSYDTAAQVVVGTDFYVTVNEEKFTTDTYEFRFGIDNGFGTEMMITVPIGRSSTITNAQNESIPYKIGSISFYVDNDLFPGTVSFPVFTPVNVLEDLDANVIAATRNVANVALDSWS